MEVVLFFLAMAVILAQDSKIKKLVKRVEVLENKASGGIDSQ